MLRYRKVGGLRFLRIGRLQLSFCVCRKPSPFQRLQALAADYGYPRHVA